MRDRFMIRDLELPGLRLVERRIRRDDRGLLDRLYSDDELKIAFGTSSVAQVNRSLTLRRGTVRGMHFQIPPYAEVKLVTCIRGEIFDVAVDLRRGSPSFLQWHGQLLSEEDATSIAIPEGFAHGFQALADGCELIYVHSARYQASAERGVNPVDPMVGITWPEAITEISARDHDQPVLPPDFLGVPI